MKTMHIHLHLKAIFGPTPIERFAKNQLSFAITLSTQSIKIALEYAPAYYHEYRQLVFRFP